MSTASYGRSRSGDRFYNPPAVRRQLQLQLQQQQQQQIQEQQQQIQEQQQLMLQKQKQLERDEIRREKQQLRRRKSSATASKKVATAAEVAPAEVSSESRAAESDDCASTSVSSKSVSNSKTNLDRFLEHTTPLVPAQYLSKTSMKGWRTQEDEFQPYFVLEDLWEFFKEWSAYGAGVPLLLNGSDSVVQYYVPYLSGIQLYEDPSRPSQIIRRAGEESDESSRETSSAGSSDCETDRGSNCINVWNQQDIGDSTVRGMKGLSLRNKPFSGSSSDEGEFSSSPGVLKFEYFEHDPPFSREPLADKISLLAASHFPNLKTYRSCDLSPSSWISVAWYPIYRIPTGPTLQNLDSCFLTFHSLSTPIHGGESEWQCHYGSCPRQVANGLDAAPKLFLPTFGMASYKFKISVWDQNAVNECPKADSLLKAADEWLRHLRVHHPDYSFFISHNFYLR